MKKGRTGYIKVCMLAEKFPPEFTGSGKQAFHLARALTEKNVKVICLCSFSSTNITVNDTGAFPVVRLRSPSYERLRSLYFMVRSLLWLLRNRAAFDILHVHGYCWAALPAMLLAKALGKKTLYKITLPGEDDPLALARSRLGTIKRSLISRFDAFVSISSRVHSIVKNFGNLPPTVVMIPNGVGEQFFLDDVAAQKARTFLIDRYHLEQNVFIISYVGSIEHRKGTDLLARAWPEIISQEPSARLFLVGPRDKNSEFCQLLEDMLAGHIGKTVFLEGNTTTPELYYRASNVFAFPSRNESFGNVLVEAMACGTACVAMEIEGITEDIIEDGINGFIVPREDPKGIVALVIKLLREKELRRSIGDYAAKNAQEKFNIGIIAEKYMTLYAHLLEQKGTG